MTQSITATPELASKNASRDAAVAEVGQLVQILAEERSPSGMPRFLADPPSGGTTPIARTTNSPGDEDSWRVVWMKNGTVSLQNVKTKRFLARRSRSELVLESAPSSGQEWRVNTVGTNRPFEIQATTGETLGVDEGDNEIVRLSSRATGWTLTPLDGASLQTLRIQAVASTASGEALVMQKFSQAPEVRAETVRHQERLQQWSITLQNDGYVQIMNLTTGTYLANFNDRELRSGGPEAYPNTLWRVRTNGGLETFALQSFHDGNINLVDIVPGDPEGKRNLINVAPPTSTNRQQWTFEPR